MQEEKYKSLPVDSVLETKEESGIGFSTTLIAQCEYKGQKIRCYAWGFRNPKDPIIPRLQRAIKAGVIFSEFRIFENAHGLAAHGTITILSRLMNSELRKLGF